jgi:hypothetical protein
VFSRDGRRCRRTRHRGRAGAARRRSGGSDPVSAPPPGSLALAVGDTIADGKPAPGAGRIESPGTEDVYRFSAAPGQRVFFRMIEADAGMSQITWRLTDRNDQELFHTCLGCGEPGMQTLSRGGAYLLTVGNPNDPATGVYRLELTTP